MIKPNSKNNIKRINPHTNLFKGEIFFLLNSLTIFFFLKSHLDRDKKFPFPKVFGKINIY